MLGEFGRDLLGADMREPTVREHIQTWLAAKAPAAAPSTAEFYKNSTSKFVAWLGAKADKEISSILRADIVAFRNRRASTAAPKTVNHELKVLRMVFRAARKDSLVTDEPAEFVETVRDRREEGARRPFKLDELRLILSHSDPEWKSLIISGLHAGQCLGDLAALRWSNLDLERKEIRLTTRKTGRRMVLPISDPLLRHLLNVSAPDARDAPIHSGAYAVLQRTGRTGGLSNQFTDILVSAGLRAKRTFRSKGIGRGAARDASGLSFHSLRHTAVSVMKEAGIPLAAVMEMVGHDTEQMSQYYTHVGRESLEQAAAALPDLGE